MFLPTLRACRVDGVVFLLEMVFLVLVPIEIPLSLVGVLIGVIAIKIVSVSLAV